MSKKDKVEERKEKIKPTKLYSIVANIWSDGIISGSLISYETFGRSKGQKVLYTGQDAGVDFLSAIRSIVPSAVPTVEGIVNQIEKDAEHEDATDCQKVGKVSIDIFSDSYVSIDCSEIIQGDRGAPKAWRLQPKEFINAMGSLVGSGGLDSFKQLTSGARNASNIINIESEE